MLCIKIFQAEKVNCVLQVRGKWQCSYFSMKFLPVKAVQDQILLMSLKTKLGSLTRAVFRVKR